MTAKIEVVEALQKVDDPEIGMNVVDLGLVYGIQVDDDRGAIQIDLTLTSPGCPLGPEIIRNIENEVMDIDDVVDVSVELVWRPLWNPAMMSDDAKEELGYDDEFGLGFSYY